MVLGVNFYKVESISSFIEIKVSSKLTYSSTAPAPPITALISPLSGRFNLIIFLIGKGGSPIGFCASV